MIKNQNSSKHLEDLDECAGPRHEKIETARLVVNDISKEKGFIEENTMKNL